MLTDYPHSKNIHNLRVVKFFNSKNKKSIEHLQIILKLQKSFTTCKWGIMYMTSKTKFYFMKQ